MCDIFFLESWVMLQFMTFKIHKQELSLSWWFTYGSSRQLIVKNTKLKIQVYSFMKKHGYHTVCNHKLTIKREQIFNNSPITATID